MKILITGAAGRIGRAIYIGLCADHEVVGFDNAPSSTSDIVASIEDIEQLQTALRGVDVVIHAAALHAPHVGHRSEDAFESINVRATEALALLQTFWVPWHLCQAVQRLAGNVGRMKRGAIRKVMRTSPPGIFRHAFPKVIFAWMSPYI